MFAFHFGCLLFGWRFFTWHVCLVFVYSSGANSNAIKESWKCDVLETKEIYNWNEGRNNHFGDKSSGSEKNMIMPKNLIVLDWNSDFSISGINMIVHKLKEREHYNVKIMPSSNYIRRNIGQYVQRYKLKGLKNYVHVLLPDFFWLIHPIKLLIRANTV